MRARFAHRRVRSDGTEEKEAKLTLFQVPNHVPIGRERLRMSDAEYERRAAPALADAYRHEQGVKDIINDVGRNIHGGDIMRSIIFAQPLRRNTGADDWGVDRVRNIDPYSGSSNVSQIHNLFDDDYATKLMDGRGDGKGYKHPGGLPRGLSNKNSQGGYRNLVPTAAMLGANDVSAAKWSQDRDQKLDYFADPFILAQAAEMGEELAKVRNKNKLYAQRSAIPMGTYDLNPGGNSYNEDLPRADDYGIGRIRSDAIMDEAIERTRGSAQVRALLQNPETFTPVHQGSPAKPHAGKSQQSSITFDHKPAESPRRGPFAGRRAKSTVFDAKSGPAAPVPPRGYYIGHDSLGGPEVKQNPYAGRITESHAIANVMPFEPDAHAAEVGYQHQRRRAQMPRGSLLVPMVEDVVFDKQGPLSGKEYEINLVPNTHEVPPQGKRSAYGGLMPEEALRAVKTHVGLREFGGQPSLAEMQEQFPMNRERKISKNYDMLEYVDYANADPRNRPPPPPPRPHSDVFISINGGEVPSYTHSDEPKGLPKRHPGPQRLLRGRGVDGAGFDHQGRQLATTLVDEVIFGRTNFQGKISLANNGANFTIDAAGEFAHR